MGGSWAMNQSRLPPGREVPSSAKMSGMAAASVACIGMVAWLTEFLALSMHRRNGEQYGDTGSDGDSTIL